jgi:tetratricopeptide (TPR) repeat protein
MQDILSTAIELHQAGQLGLAAQLYQKVLAKEAKNAPALHLLGVLHHQRGEHARAVELIAQAVALRPNVPAFHANLAEAYRALGQLERAVGCCRAALQLWPEYPEALCNLGVALQGLGRSAEAIEPLRRALELRADFATAHNNLGIALRELGQQDEALVHFQRAVEVEPAFAPARTNLGQMLLDRGRAEEALPHCQEAARLSPDLPAMHHNLGNVLRALEQLVEARAAYLEALRLDPKLALAQAHLGLILQKEGELDSALVWLKQATELEPANATFWGYLAELQDEREEPSESIPCWERVIALAAEERPGPHLSLGWALQEEGRLDEAREHYGIALGLNPELAGAHLNMGGLHEELGAMAEAESAFRDALRLQPRYAAAHARLATLLRGKLPRPDLAALEERLADPELEPGPRGRLLFARAHVLDARGEFTDAADCLRQANALAREQNKDRRAYIPADHEQFVDRLIGAFSGDWFAAAKSSGLETPRPVFVFGLPRSGTTLIEQVLASHPRIHGAGELRLGRQSFEAIPRVVDRSDPPNECVPALDRAALRRLGEEHLARLDSHAAGRPERIVDKMPDNYMYLGLLAGMFPHAVFIHSRRDLRDVAVSCWMTDFRSIRWANDPEHIASRFAQYRRLMEHWQAALPVPIHAVDYEDTVSDLEGVARRLIAACGLEWHPACLEFHRTQRPVRTASITQVRQPIYKQSVARWKNYEHDLGALFAALPAAQ